MAVTARDFFNDLVPHLKGLDPKTVRKLTLVLEAGKAAEITVEMYAHPLGSGGVLSKTYELHEVATEQVQEEPALRDGCVNVTGLADEYENYVLPVKGYR